MKLSQLLRRRTALLQQARLATLAEAYCQMERLVTRITRAGLRGKVSLQAADPAAERYWPELTALDGSQAVIEEHFTEANILELADLMASLAGGDAAEATFQLEDLGALFLAPLQHQLEQAGVEFDRGTPRLAPRNEGGANWP